MSLQKYSLPSWHFCHLMSGWAILKHEKRRTIFVIWVLQFMFTRARSTQIFSAENDAHSEQRKYLYVR